MTPDEFNARYPVGTACRYWPGFRAGDGGRLSATRTPAWRMPSGTVVVSVEGYSGGIALTHVEMTPGETYRPLDELVDASGQAPIVTAADLAKLPENAVVRDRFGDVGVIFSGHIHFPETSPQTFVRAAKKYGPFVDVIAEARSQGATQALEESAR